MTGFVAVIAVADAVVVAVVGGGLGLLAVGRVVTGLVATGLAGLFVFVGVDFIDVWG